MLTSIGDDNLLMAYTHLGHDCRVGNHCIIVNGALVAGQPNGAASWFPCDDHPGSKASYRIQISTDSPYRAIANGELVSRRVRAGHTTWTYEQAEPTSTYLATLQIGMYDLHRMPKAPVPMQALDRALACGVGSNVAGLVASSW